MYYTGIFSRSDPVYFAPAERCEPTDQADQTDWAPAWLTDHICTLITRKGF